MKSFILCFLLGAGLLRADSVWHFSLDDNQVVIDLKQSGQLIFWKVGNKILVDNPSHKDGLQIQLANQEAATRFRVESNEVLSTEVPTIRLQGYLSGESVQIPATLTYSILEGGEKIRLQVDLNKPSSSDLDVEKLDWTLPLALNPRKRVYFLGDYGFDWETRYFYQYMVDSPGNILPEAERNEWRFFALDQMGPGSFRIWKAESRATAPLIMQEGVSAAPLVQVYDQNGGVTLTYENLSENAPKSLKVDAQDGGTLIVSFWSEQQKPASIDQSGLFKSHELILEALPSEEAVLAQRALLKKRFPPRDKPSPEKVMQEPNWVRAAKIVGNVPLYVTGGFPFKKGELREVDQLEVYLFKRKTPLQAEALAYWPDGSVKWALLTFPISPDDAVANCPPPRVSLRNGKFVPFKVEIASSPRPVSPGIATRQLENGNIEILNDDVSIIVGQGESWLKNWSINGRQVVKPEKTKAYVTYHLAPNSFVPFERELSGGTIDNGVLRVDKIKIEESGPLRTIIRLEGLTTNREATRIILRLMMYSGRADLHLTHTAEFLFKDPRNTFLTAMGIEFPLIEAINPPIHLGGVESDVTGLPWQQLLLLQASPVHAKFLGLKNNHWKTESANSRCPGWLSASKGGDVMVATMRNFWQTAPKALAVNLAESVVDFQVWPTDAGPMDVRRYSNYPHRSQGESVKPRNDWVQTTYYPEDPFVGVSRTHEMTLGFWNQRDDESFAASLAADWQSPPLLYAGWEQYSTTGVVLSSFDRESWPRAWSSLTRLTNFWLYHQTLHGWHGFWNFGDVRHLLGSGYGWILPAEKLAQFKKPGAPQPEPKAGRSIRRRDYSPPNDWAFDNGRWGWSNTEGLPNLFFQNEYLRNGERAVYFAAEALARHSRDVVVRHDGKWFGAGTRHGVQHWSDGNHEERQTTPTEYRIHYFLSGDSRTRDVVEKLYDRHYSKTAINVDAAHSGRLGGLLFHWELSGSPDEAKQLERYIAEFVSEDGISVEPDVQFPGPVRNADPRGLNSGSMFFHTFGGMHALIEYQQMTNDPNLARALIKMADAAINDPGRQERYATGKYGSSEIFWPPIAFAALHADNPQPYRAFFQSYIQDYAWRRLYQTVTLDPLHWTGPTATLLGGVPMSFFWSNWSPYILSGLPDKEIWGDDISRQFQLVEKEGSPSRRSALSWQSEYDNFKELSDYLGSQQPWKSEKEN